MVGSDKTALVIGGTGMLRDATLWLTSHARTTLLVSRRASLFAANQAGVIAIDADWNEPGFAAKLRSAIEDAGPVGIALLWLHDAERVLNWLLRHLPTARIVLVLGSMDGRPQLIDAMADVATVRLGSVRDAGGRRWLTHAEISAAAVAAQRSGASSIVGEHVPVR